MAFKITQLAKDLGIKSKEITELMTARGMECKTTQKTLTAGEFNVVFEVLTRKAQISDIDSYLFGDTYIPTKAPEKAAPAKAEESAVAEAAPAPEVKEEKKEAKKAPAAKKAEQKAAPAEAAAPEKPAPVKEAAPEVKSAPQKEAAPTPSEKEEKAAPAPAAPARPNPRTYNIPQNLRATMQRPAAPAQGAARPTGDRPANDRFAPRSGANPPAQGGARPASDRFSAPSFGGGKPAFGES